MDLIEVRLTEMFNPALGERGYGPLVIQYWDMEADAVFKQGWKENLDAWNKVGSDRPYHYLGSAIWFNRIGKGFGETMLELIANRD